MTFILQIKPQKYIFHQNTTTLSATDLSIFNPCYDGIMHAFATTWELKTKTFTANSEAIKEVIGIQVTFTLEISIKKNNF